MGCGVYWRQIGEVEGALETMSRYGIAETDPAYQSLYRQRGALLAQVGQKFPRVDYSLSMWREFSPQRVRVWFDPEFGFNAEIREKPGAPPTYKLVSGEVAAAIIKDEVTPEMKAQLMAPDEYLGE